MNTRDELKEYILRRLGAPLVQVEVSTDMLDDIINDTIKEFSEFAYSTELIQYIKVDCQGMGEYNISKKVQAVLKLSKGEGFFFGNSVRDGFVANWYTDMITNSLGDAVGSVINLSNQAAMMDKYFGSEINHNYNIYKRKLYIFEDYVGPLLMEAAVEYEADDDGDDIFNQTWVKAMCVARARLMQSTVTGKYSGNLIGGSAINYDRMESLALQEIEQLKEELLTKYAGPAPIMVG